ncbi:ion transporter [Mesorhizobium sp. 10J20-29]|jgi:voltage-gated potassium channel
MDQTTPSRIEPGPADGGTGWRHWLYVNLHTQAWPGSGLSPLNKAIAVIIVVAVVMAIVQSEPTVLRGREDLFRAAEMVLAVIFLAEYAGRVWTIAENPAFGEGWRGRLRYMRSFTAIIDVIVLASLFITLMGAEGTILRLFRLVRIVMLAKLGRYSTAMLAIAQAVRDRRYELLMSLAVAGMLLLVSSTLLFLVEGAGQPDAFGSIPRAMWWSVATLTTVGYGDAVPLTILGKLLAGLTAITGIGLIAMPTGILASAFSNALQEQREAREKEIVDSEPS